MPLANRRKTFDSEVPNRTKLSLATHVAVILVLISFATELCAQDSENELRKDEAKANQLTEIKELDEETQGADLDASASELSSSGSHRIVASGWPMTSQMWPSLEIYGKETNKTHWPELVDPFIFTDKPHTIDYSLLLAINSTIMDILKNKLKPKAANLSFDYYFSFDQKVNAKPMIKIEVERKEFDHLEPDEQRIKSKVWMPFNKRIDINEIALLENRDWLKFSLVNRQSPSLVAIRYLKIEFLSELASEQQQPPRGKPTEAPIVERPASSRPPEVAPPAPINVEPPQSNMNPRIEAPQQSPMEPTYVQPEISIPAVESGSRGSLPAASNNLETVVKPPEKDETKQKKSWFSLGTGKRRKRDIPVANSIVLSCFTSDNCDWHTDSGEKLQWSLSRMPPSTNEVHSGYFYLSNRHPSSQLIIQLNQTNAATVADQESDHCVELAIYVTESSQLDLFRLRRTPESGSWQKGSRLVSWAPTLAGAGKGSLAPRHSLKDSRLPALEDGRNGFTRESLCFGEFFVNQMHDCGAGNCALAFEMRAATGRQLEEQATQAPKLDSAAESQSESLALSLGDWTGEQVVAVALLHEFTTNKPLRKPAKWLESWARHEVSPLDSWSFYPKLDFATGNESVALVNLFDGSHYAAESIWFSSSRHLEFSCLLVATESGSNQTDVIHVTSGSQIQPEESLFSVQVEVKLLDEEHSSLFVNKTQLDWPVGSNQTIALDLSFVVSNQLTNKQQLDARPVKILIDASFSLPLLRLNSSSTGFDQTASYSIQLVNASLADRCFPNPCVFGSCSQNGTGPEDWNCLCEERHRGRRCQFGRWCQVAHLAPPQATKTSAKISNQNTRVSGQEFCQRKLGQGSECAEIDLPLDDSLYQDEGQTFRCSCKEDFYLSDEQRCKQAHPCSSVICPSIGMICDEQRAFNKTMPCQCDERQGWIPSMDTQQVAGCIRRQCRDPKRDCGFNAHICLPTLPNEPPICKCVPKFALETDAQGQKHCRSTACTLPTLNDCQHICQPHDDDLERPFRCACHPGFVLDSDGRSCRPAARAAPSCRPSCPSETQICTEAGCRCKQGFVPEGEIRVSARNRQPLAEVSANSSSGQLTEYTQSVRCLNVCSLSYAENKLQFERIEAVCPLGLCEPHTFNCRCSDPQSSALINTKYEPIVELDADSKENRTSPLCRLRRVCEPNSTGDKICKSQGAICVPDYQKPAMFDCICPPSTEKRVFGQATVSEFSCEPKCGSKKSDCLRRQAVCRLIDQDEARCECLPGLMLEPRDQKCYLASYSYSFNLLVANRYYQPESKFHKIIQENATDTRIFEENKGEKPDLSEIIPQFNKSPVLRSTFITDYNQCNISQLIPKSVVDDPYEHDMETYVGYMDQCNQKIHQNQRAFSLNSKLAEDLRQSLRQQLRDFTVTTSNSTCQETDSSGMTLNCTIYLQSNEPVLESTLASIFNDCDKKAHDKSLCWIKPRLLLKHPDKKTTASNSTELQRIEFNFRRIVPCEIDSFCGQDAYSVLLDSSKSLCSCKCPADIEVIDVKDLEPKHHESIELRAAAVKEICAPKNHCGPNSTFCLGKTGSVCQYDVRLGSRCQCVYPSYEDSTGKCVEITFSQLDSTLIVIIIVLGTGLLVSMAINLAVVAKTKSFFGRSKQYPMSEFASQRAQHQAQNSRIINRSTGVPNPVFTDD